MPAPGGCHGGQFLVDGRTDCARCHAGAAGSFVELVFDHDRDARFPLDAAHELVACTACHREVQDGAERRVRYRPLGVECADCHGDQKRSLRRKEKRPR